MNDSATTWKGENDVRHLAALQKWVAKHTSGGKCQEPQGVSHATFVAVVPTMNGHHPHRHPQRVQVGNASGWTVHDVYDEKQPYASSASWLARSSSNLPLNYRDQEKHRSWIDVDPTSPFAAVLHRLNRLKSLWYTSSALSSNTGKVILNQFRYPVTLTFVQFGFVAAYCLLFMSPVIRFSTLRKPTKAILQSTFPMGCFQVGGHIFSSMAISRIPVSTVHTIKALSPLFTVAAYALVFGVSYSAKTYFSLLPLTIGVMLACSFDVSVSNATGLLCAFGSAIVFVSSNIFFKKIMPSNNSHSSGAGSHHKLDKVNLLFYSSSMAFLLMVPIWMWTDLPSLMSHTHRHVDDHHSHPALATMTHFWINGTVHFLQNVLAFVLLARTSPVTYSIASLIKRVAVICIAVVWFKQRVHVIQGFGIALTFVGLWCYHGAKSDVERGEKKVRRVENAREGMLPSTRSEVESETETSVEKDPVQVQSSGIPASTAYARPRANSTLAHYVYPAPPPSRPPIPHTSHSHSSVPRHAHHAPTYSQTHPHMNPNLSIHVTPHALPQIVVTAKTETTITSPVDSYPSPPPSVDSTPSSPEMENDLQPQMKPERWERPRRSTLTGHKRVGSIGVARPGIPVA
ncbi:TPT-domain-containing protein [Panus rudis PR-1116 ss-1]|nr:TPT-domain-containing protein [Panus rudis PR-1116 ss-1]